MIKCNKYTTVEEIMRQLTRFNPKAKISIAISHEDCAITEVEYEDYLSDVKCHYESFIDEEDGSPIVSILFHERTKGVHY